MSDLLPGTMIGPYRIRQVAGRGAVGVVYEADHEILDRRVAIKTLSAQFASEATYRARFSREAQGVAGVNHPNIITVFDAGQHDDIPYLVMTYVAGPDLERVLSDRGGTLQDAETILICAAVANALDAAGTQGLAHRDVKPANIMLEGWEPERYGGRRRRPHVYLTDFGLIKSSAQATVTQTGQFVGTLLYMSPEQIHSRAVPASDQYSLACVMWECLTGDFPFTPSGNSMLSLIQAHLGHDPPSISVQAGRRWPGDVDAVFRRALSKHPEDRFASCTEFVDHATRALGLGASAPRVTPAPPLAALSTSAELDRPAGVAGPPPGQTQRIPFRGQPEGGASVGNDDIQSETTDPPQVPNEPPARAGASPDRVDGAWSSSAAGGPTIAPGLAPSPAGATPPSFANLPPTNVRPPDQAPGRRSTIVLALVAAILLLAGAGLAWWLLTAAG